MRSQQQHNPIPLPWRTLSVAAWAALLTVTAACGSFVDLDVTLFERVDLNEDFGEDFQVPTDMVGNTMDIVRRNEMDLSDDVDSNLMNTFGGIELHDLSYRVPENAMTAMLTEVRVYVGPLSAQTIEDPQVVELAVIPVIPAGVPLATTTLEVDPLAKEALITQLKELHLAFFVTGKVHLEDGAAVPSGAGMIEIDVKATIKKG